MVVQPPRRVRADSFSIAAFARRTASVTLVLPALDEAESIKRAVTAGVRAREDGVLDEVVVVDGGSHDDTAAQAEASGARVVDAAGVFPESGPVLGKGDAVWRALGAVDSEVVAFMDADLEGDLEVMIRGLVGPLVVPEAALDSGGPGPNAAWAPQVEFVKGSFHRIAPDGADEAEPFDGGRVTEMMVRPLLNLWRPDLAAFYQPLSGQVAGRTNLLRSLPILTGYAVEIGMLLDVVDRVGVKAVVEVDLGTLRNRPRTSAALAPMAQEVLYGFARRVLPSAARPRWRPYARPRRQGDRDHDRGAELDVIPSTVVERPPIDPFGAEVFNPFLPSIPKRT